MTWVKSQVKLHEIVFQSVIIFFPKIGTVVFVMPYLTIGSISRVEAMFAKLAATWSACAEAPPDLLLVTRVRLFAIVRDF